MRNTSSLVNVTHVLDPDYIRYGAREYLGTESRFQQSQEYKRFSVPTACMTKRQERGDNGGESGYNLSTDGRLSG